MTRRLVLCVVCLILAGVGCPRLPPVDHCTPGALTCIGDRPHVCSQSQRWAPASPAVCSSVGFVCCPTRSPFGGATVACVPSSECTPPDAGVATDGGAE